MRNLVHILSAYFILGDVAIIPEVYTVAATPQRHMKAQRSYHVGLPPPGDGHDSAAKREAQMTGLSLGAVAACLSTEAAAVAATEAHGSFGSVELATRRQV
jgi:hypothetical protein